MKVSIIFLYLTIILACTTFLFFQLFMNRQIKLRRVLKRSQRKHVLQEAASPEFHAGEIKKISQANTIMVEKVRKALEEDKVYLDCELSIESFSRMLGTNKANLSKVINESFGRSFPNLLGDYRIAEALRIFNDPDSELLTLDAIASMCGFNSRQVFHKAFKKRIGVPPRRFNEK